MINQIHFCIVCDSRRFFFSMAKVEDVEMICLLDSRLDDLDSLRSCEMTCRELGRTTGKTWTSRLISRKDTMRVGGAMILHTLDWTNVTIKEVIKYGTITRIKGKWNGTEYVVVPVYRPCYGQSEGSMRLALDIDFKGKFEEQFWAELKLASDGGNAIIGFDFNMGVSSMEKAIREHGMDVKLTPNPGQITFRRWDSVGERQQESAIDHILISRDINGGMSTVDSGIDAKDHAIIVGWIKLKVKVKRVKEKKAVTIPTMRPTDKGAIRQYEMIFKRIPVDRVQDMTIDEIVETSTRGVRKIMESRNTKKTPNGWSPGSRLMTMRISVHGTAVKMAEKLDYNKVMQYRVEELKRKEKKMILNEDEVAWLMENGLSKEPLDWMEWKALFGKSTYNAMEYHRLMKLNCGRRRKELRNLHSDRMNRIQSEADIGKTGGVIREILNKRKGYKMEVIVDDEECIKDPIRVSERATEFFAEWFHRTEEERARDMRLVDLVSRTRKDEFMAFAGELGAPSNAISHVWKGMMKKEISDEGKKEGEDLKNYIPTLEEFLATIKKMNPHSAGGISGLTYFMVQKWDDNVKIRVYEELKGYYERKEIPKGWGNALLAPIP